MENNSHILTALSADESGVIALRCPDRTQFDPGCIAQLFADLHAADAEQIVCRLLEKIAAQLSCLQQAYVGRDLDKISDAARNIRLVADQMGLAEMSDASGHVDTCATHADGVALGATIARLERAFDIAVKQVWNFRAS